MGEYLIQILMRSNVFTRRIQSWEQERSLSPFMIMDQMSEISKESKFARKKSTSILMRD